MEKKKRSESLEGRLAEVCRACADETRLRLLNLLGGGVEVCVCHLVEVLGESQPKVSRHLAYLRGSGLVRDRKDGLWVYYRLSESLDEATAAVLAALREGSRETAARDLARLGEVRREQPILRLTSRPVSSTAAAAAGASVQSLPQDLEVELL